MEGNVCPKCGSTEIFNNECLKCGVLISKVRSSAPSVETTSQVSISFVSPGSVTQPPTAAGSGAVLQPVTPAKSASGFAVALKRSQTQTNLIGAVVLLLLIGGGYVAYQHFVAEASYYNGFYWNMHHRFALNFPEKVWRHMEKREEVSAIGYKDAIDGFFLGRNADNAEVLMVIWADRSDDVAPETFDEDSREAMLEWVTEKLHYRMLGSNAEYEITEMEDIRLDGNDGFVLQVDLKKNFDPLTARIYCAFFENYSYMMMFVGKEEYLAKNDEQIRSLMRTYNYREKLLM